jgi:NAD(P)-dependent dehydrogenase (short-subunit alcohol dehydrogenase family)
MTTTRSALVTGATRGIGFAIAARLLERGFAVAVSGTTDTGVARAVQALIARGGDPSRVLGRRCDVRDTTAVHALVDEVASSTGGLDVLVNNAGIGVFGPVADMSAADWQRVLDTNLSGVFHACHAAIPHLRRRGGGWIINVSSLASRNPFVSGAAYSATKAGLNAFSEALLQEVRHDGIRVSYICPGSVATGFAGHDEAAGADWKLHADDVALAVVHLLDHPGRSLPSRIDIRPSRPPRK